MVPIRVFQCVFALTLGLTSIRAYPNAFMRKMSISEINKAVNLEQSSDRKIVLIDSHLRLYFAGQHEGGLQHIHALELAAIRARECPHAPRACLDISRWYNQSCATDGEMQAVFTNLMRPPFLVATGPGRAELEKTVRGCLNQPAATRLLRTMRLLALVNAPDVTRQMTEAINASWKTSDATVSKSAVEALLLNFDEFNGDARTSVEALTALSFSSSGFINSANLGALAANPAQLARWLESTLGALGLIGKEEKLVDLVRRVPALSTIKESSIQILIAQANCAVWNRTRQTELCRQVVEKIQPVPSNPIQATLRAILAADLALAQGKNDQALAALSEGTKIATANNFQTLKPWLVLMEVIAKQNLGKLGEAQLQWNHETSNWRAQVRGSRKVTWDLLGINLALRQKDYKEALKVAGEIRQKLDADFSKPVPYHVIASLAIVAAAVGDKNQDLAKSAYARLVADYKVAGAFGHYMHFAEAFLAVLSGDAQRVEAELKKAALLLGAEHPEFLTYKAILVDLQKLKK